MWDYFSNADGAWHELFMEAEAIRRPWLNALLNFLEERTARNGSGGGK